MSPDPDPQKPAIVDLDEDEASIPDDRTCPICRTSVTYTDRGSVMFPTFSLMMRHWERVHPDRAPERALDTSNPYSGDVVRRPIECEDKTSLDGWLVQERDHPQEAAETRKSLKNLELREEPHGSHAA